MRCEHCGEQMFRRKGEWVCYACVLRRRQQNAVWAWRRRNRVGIQGEEIVSVDYFASVRAVLLPQLRELEI